VHKSSYLGPCPRPPHPYCTLPLEPQDAAGAATKKPAASARGAKRNVQEREEEAEEGSADAIVAGEPAAKKRRIGAVPARSSERVAKRRLEAAGEEEAPTGLDAQPAAKKRRAGPAAAKEAAATTGESSPDVPETPVVRRGAKAQAQAEAREMKKAEAVIAVQQLAHAMRVVVGGGDAASAEARVDGEAAATLAVALLIAGDGSSKVGTAARAQSPLS
jgi:hypothetical protein